MLGICIGVVMGRSRIARDMVTPYIEILRPIPAVAWIPLAILMWPTEESSIVYITFLGALFPDRPEHRARRRADAGGPGAGRADRSARRGCRSSGTS